MTAVHPLSDRDRVLPGVEYAVLVLADVSPQSTAFAAALAAVGVEVTDDVEDWPTSSALDERGREGTRALFHARFPREDTVAGWKRVLGPMLASALNVRWAWVWIARDPDRDAGAVGRAAEETRRTVEETGSFLSGLRLTGNAIAVGLLAVGAWLWLRAR